MAAPGSQRRRGQRQGTSADAGQKLAPIQRAQRQKSIARNGHKHIVVHKVPSLPPSINA